MASNITVEKAVAEIAAIAADPAHGYDQQNRWGPDYDCSSLVIHAWQTAGVPLKCTYTGDMRGDMLRHGFRDVTAEVTLKTGEGLLRGDVLLNCARHTALYIGSGMIIHASANEHGTARLGTKGDQTGREICSRSYFNYPWDCVLRYMPDTAAEDNAAAGDGETGILPVLAFGAVGGAVGALQGALRALGFDPRWIDGDFGARTQAALTEFQASRGLTPDGVCAAAVWRELLNVKGAGA